MSRHYRILPPNVGNRVKRQPVTLNMAQSAVSVKKRYQHPGILAVMEN